MSDDHIFATHWIDAIHDARQTLKLDRIAHMLRDNHIPLEIEDRRLLAELLVPEHPASKLSAILKKRKTGRGDRDDRNLDFYLAVEKFKAKEQITDISEEARLKIWKEMGFENASHETCRTAEKRGRKLWENARKAVED